MSKRILCIGDSNTYGYDPRSYIDSRYPEDVRWAGRLEGYEVINRGLNGMTVPRDYARHFGIIRIEEPGLITVMLGTNDVLTGSDAEQTAAKMENFISHLKEAGIPILLIAPPPVEFGEWVQDEDQIDESQDLAELYREIAEKTGCMFADAGEWGVELCFDGVHFSAEGHITFSQKLEEFLRGIEWAVKEE